MAHSQQPRPPPTPSPSEDRLFMDWSSIRSESPPARAPPHNIPVGGILTTSEMEGMHETGQTTLQPSQPISEQIYTGAADDVIQENLPTTPNVHQQSLRRSSMMSDIRVNDTGTNTSDVVVESTRNGLRTSSLEATAQNSISIVDVLLPSSLGDQATMPHVNLSISGYKPDYLRTSGMRTLSM